jgi:NAD(P)-dependent dehydrogenase (short-subunit alcohol dehydrogenase family)
MSYLDDLFSLRDRTALVTGASSGIGYAVAESMARAGAAVVLVARDEQRLSQAEQSLTAQGLTALSVAADLGQRGHVDRLCSELGERGIDPDVLVNAAGVNIRPPMGDLDESDVAETIAVNLSAPFLLGQYVGPRMAARGWGRIINVGSQQSVRAFGNSGVYGVAKAAIAGLSRSQAEAWSPYGVCCNTLVPGFVATRMTAQVLAEPGREEALAARTMVGRNGLASDFCGAAVFLASDASAYVTGQMIFVDGGFSVT